MISVPWITHIVHERIDKLIDSLAIGSIVAVFVVLAESHASPAEIELDASIIGAEDRPHALRRFTAYLEALAGRLRIVAIYTIITKPLFIKITAVFINHAIFADKRLVFTAAGCNHQRQQDFN